MRIFWLLNRYIRFSFKNVGRKIKIIMIIKQESNFSGLFYLPVRMREEIRSKKSNSPG